MPGLWSRGFTSEFLLAPVMLFFQVLSCRQRAMKIASVATFELAMWQLKKLHKKITRNFFLRFFQLLCCQFKGGGYNCNFHCKLATQQNLKNHITGVSNNRSCNCGLKPSECYLLSRWTERQSKRRGWPHCYGRKRSLWEESWWYYCRVNSIQTLTIDKSPSSAPQ